MKPRHVTSVVQNEAFASAKAVGLRYVNDGEPGIKRVRRGQSFRYVETGGRVVRASVHLKRIRSLAIPPAWVEVWICANPEGHLQATGRDAKGRKQFKYHPLWRQVRDATKYNRMIEFGEVLPRIRAQVARDIARQGLDREKILATIIRIMDLTFIRVGNEEYARQNKSYGLTTMKDGHANIRGSRVQFIFRGKSGKDHRIEIQDRRIASIVKRCRDIPGQDLFQWLDADGTRHDVTSGDINDYLRQVSGADFTAKDFRTWAGSVLASQALKAVPQFKSQGEAKGNIKAAIHSVAEKLGNTPAVCRKCYVHPFVFDGYLNGKLCGNGHLSANKKTVAARRASNGLSREEGALLQFLRCCRRADRRKVQRSKPSLACIPRAWRPRYTGLEVTQRK